MPDDAEKPRPVQVMPIEHARLMGPMLIDMQIRQAIQQCWMILPQEQRTLARVEQEIRRLLERALRNLHEDASAFGIGETSGGQ